MNIVKRHIRMRTIFSLLLVLFSPAASYANPIVMGVYGLAGLEHYLIIPTIIIEYLIIFILLKPREVAYRLLGGVIMIHLITFPLTVIAGSFVSFFAEAIPLVLEPLYYKHLFEKYEKRELLNSRPVDKKIWQAVIIANLVTFAMGVGITTYLQNYTTFEGSGRNSKARMFRAAARAQIDSLSEALDSYKKDVGRYPTTEGLSALVIDPRQEGWRGPYLKGGVPSDPWGVPFHYQSPGMHGEFDLSSYGADKSPGGEGFGEDVTNWK